MGIPRPAWFVRLDALRVLRSLRAWRMRRRLGLPPLSTPPVTSVPEVDRAAFTRSGYRPRPVAVLPYERQGMHHPVEEVVLDLDDPEIELAGDVPVWRDPEGEPQDHPVYLAQYALAALGAYDRTGDAHYLDRVLATAAHLISTGERDDVGALWFPYRFSHRYYDVAMPVPWWSSMAQGQPLSLFCRLARLLPDDARWRELADATFRSFDGWRALGRPWITTMDAHGCLWFEEYAGDVEPLLVINGQVYALYGLYDYAMLTGDAHAIELFDGGATTIRTHFASIRVPGGVSYYCAREGYCQRPEWQNDWYHPIHIQQLQMLAAMTGDETFSASADLLIADTSAADVRRS